MTGLLMVAQCPKPGPPPDRALSVRTFWTALLVDEPELVFR